MFFLFWNKILQSGFCAQRQWELISVQTLHVAPLFLETSTTTATSVIGTQIIFHVIPQLPFVFENRIPTACWFCKYQLSAIFSESYQLFHVLCCCVFSSLRFRICSCRLLGNSMSHYPPRPHYGPDQVVYQTSSQAQREGCRDFRQVLAMQHQQFGWNSLMFPPWPGMLQHGQCRRPPLLPNPHQTSQYAVPSLMSLSLPSPPQSWPDPVPSHSHILQSREDGAGGRKKQKSRQTVPNRNLRIVTTGDDRQHTALQKRTERFLNNDQPTMRPTILPEKARIPLPEKVHISMPWQGKADPEVLQDVLKSIQGCQQSDPPSANTKPDGSDDEILIVPVPPKLAPPVIELDSSLDSPQSPARSFKRVPESSPTVLSDSGLAGKVLPVKKELDLDGADRSAESNPTPSKTPSSAPQPTPAHAAVDRSSKPNTPYLLKTSSMVPEPAPAHAAAERSSNPASKSKTPLVAEPAPAHSPTTTTTPAASQQVTKVPSTARTHTESTNKRRSDRTPPDSPTALKKRKLQSPSTISLSSPVPPGDLRELLRKRQVERTSSSAPASPPSDSLIPSAPGDLRMLEQHRKVIVFLLTFFRTLF